MGHLHQHPFSNFGQEQLELAWTEKYPHHLIANTISKDFHLVCMDDNKWFTSLSSWTIYHPRGHYLRLLLIRRTTENPSGWTALKKLWNHYNKLQLLTFFHCKNRWRYTMFKLIHCPLLHCYTFKLSCAIWLMRYAARFFKTRDQLYTFLEFTIVCWKFVSLLI